MKKNYVVVKIIVFIAFLFLGNYVFEERCKQIGRCFYEYEFFILAWPFIATVFLYFLLLCIKNKIAKKVCCFFVCIFGVYGIACLMYRYIW